ncbi:hypothetical protein [Bradyrhizobium sp. LHD-71]|uniref:hypothetical protein n=1 Tax=Bradyrhizobium sp. LHD-71 TaxID=3072141 RepID=UPI0028107B3C|nr:hypothetical protein [Bradyrhizobium sp. LHD-71]MDQ8730706.1 hypothetical protein [Bradyrhizobium sp. LHD-71]
MIALALNLGLSFGHHHFSGVPAQHDIAAIEHSHSAAPDGDSEDDHDHDGSSAIHPCLTCIALTTAALAAGPLVLPVRASPLHGVLAAAASSATEGRHHTSFEARAPPQS